MTINLLLIDDDPKPDFKSNVEKSGLNIEVTIWNLANHNPLKIIEQLFQNNFTPDLILIDHRLTQTETTSQSFVKTGSSLVPIIRSHWPKCPIFAYTAVPKECGFDVSKRVYEEIFEKENDAELIPFIPIIVQGYKEVIACRKLNNFLELLGCPVDEKNALLLSMPDSLKGDYGNKADSLIHDIYRWFKHKFYKLPGFLYNKDWTAVTMGIAPEHFDLYAGQVDDAKYTGIWKNDSDPRWWRKKLFNIATSNDENCLKHKTQRSGQISLKVKKEHFSKCTKCGQLWPEIMAFADETESSNLYPMHRRCTQSHPRLKVSPYYEPPKILLED